MGESAQGRTYAERNKGIAENTRGAETFGQPAGQRNGNGFGDCIRRNDPCTLTVAGTQTAGDMGDGYVGDCRVQNGDEVPCGQHQRGYPEHRPLKDSMGFLLHDRVFEEIR